MAEETQADAKQASSDVQAAPVAVTKRSGRRVQKVGIVASDKMQKTVVVRVDRLVLHRKYRRYVRRTSRFMAHDEMGSTVGDKVRIVETRPLSARKRWRVVEILQKAAK
jgi:small subunit ribosomal protein S17